MIAVSIGDDKREQCVDITDKGRDTFNIAIPLWEKAQAEVVGSPFQEIFTHV